MGDTTKGLYGKFIVRRTDGRDMPGEKHEGCEYFVLDLNHDKHAYMALRAYATSCRDEYPLLSDDLREKSVAMRAAGLFPTISPALREAIRKAGEEGRAFAEHNGEVVFINDGKNEERWAEHHANACPACCGSGHKDDAKNADLSWCANLLVEACHEASKGAGWWNDIRTGEELVRRPHVVGEKLMLVVSEVAEAMEGHRKNLPDDKLPHRPMIEVELADAVIRICDLAGALGLDLGGAIAEKMAFNKVRPDHKPENRLAAGGKAY